VNSKRLFFVGLVLAGCLAFGQAVPRQGVQKKIKFPEYDSQTGKIKSLLMGEQAVPQANGSILIKGVRLETYVYDGSVRKADLIIEAPQCFFRFRTRIASSPGAMRVSRADGSASISGRGFTWSQRDSVLVISSRVRTIMQSGFKAE